jgi:hypothetical protein
VAGSDGVEVGWSRSRGASNPWGRSQANRRSVVTVSHLDLGEVLLELGAELLLALQRGLRVAALGLRGLSRGELGAELTLERRALLAGARFDSVRRARRTDSRGRSRGPTPSSRVDATAQSSQPG